MDNPPLDTQNIQPICCSLLDSEFARFIGEFQGERLNGDSTPIPGWAMIATIALREGHQYAPLSAFAGQVLITPDGESLQLPQLDELQKEIRDFSQNNPLTLSCISSPAQDNTIPRTPLILEDDQRLYLQRYYDAECFIAQCWSAFIRKEECPISPEIAEKKEQILNAGEHPCDEHQRQAVELALKKHLTLITGGPGTGKTTVITRILLLELLRNKELSFVLCAPTGKGQARIVESIREEIASLEKHLEIPDEINIRLTDPDCCTIHSLIIRNRQHLPYDLVVLDEGSMASLQLMKQFFQKLKPTARVLICGDHNQLPSVESGVVLAELYKASRPGAPLHGCACQLKTNHRSNSAPNIIAFSQQMWEPSTQVEQLAQEMLDTHQKDYWGINWPAQEEDKALALQRLVQALVDEKETPHSNGTPLEGIAAQLKAGLKELRELAQDPAAPTEKIQQAFAIMDSFKILCALREGPFGTTTVNAAIAKALDLPDKAPGTPIIITRNDWTKGLHNGECGIIWQGIDNNVAYFPGSDSDTPRCLPLYTLPDFEPVYAMTVHKSQGSGYSRALFLLPHQPSPVATRELVYTAITRAKKFIAVLGTPQVLSHSLQQTVQRHSQLEDRLVKNTPTPNR